MEFLLAEEQKKARKQILSFCGGRRPRVEERAKLTVIEAIILEALRVINLCTYIR